MEEKSGSKEALKSLLKEEVSPSEKEEIEEKLSKNVEKLVDYILVQFNCHKKGLSEQQAGYLFHKVVETLDEKIKEFTTKKRPSNISNFEEIVDKLDI